jgi:psiF repeat
MQGCAKISRRENATAASFIGGSASWRNGAGPFSNLEVLPMTISTRMAAALGASFLLFATPVFAQSTAAPAAAGDSAAPAPKGKKAQTPESLECSKQADAKGLHGKERKKFRSECKKAAMDKKQ